MFYVFMNLALVCGGNLYVHDEWKKIMKKNKTRWKPVAALLLIAPGLGELFSGSAPPVEYFQPVTLLLLTMLYGMGALLVRETVRRWKRGWLAILLLGFAYGIFEEGIMVRSFFDPSWGDLGVLATYGRALGVNWIWSAALTIFHGVISISIPICLTELLFPQHQNTHWLTQRGYVVVILLFLLNAPLGALFGMNISLLGFVMSVLAIGVLIYLARNWNWKLSETTKQNGRSNWKIAFAGFVCMDGLIAGLWIMPALSIPWVLTLIYLIVLPWVAIAWLSKLGIGVWNEVQRWSVCFGLMLPWILLSIISEFDNANRPDDTRGMAIAALGLIIFLIILRIAIVKRKEAH